MQSKFIVTLFDPETDNRQVGVLTATSPEEAGEEAVSFNPGWRVEKVKHSRGGARPGAGRVSKWGDGVTTHRYRLPKTFGDNAEQIMDSIEVLQGIIESWEERTKQSAAASAGAQPSERYKYVAQMCAELKAELANLPESWD